MKNIVVVVLLAALAWYGYGKYHHRVQPVASDEVATDLAQPPQSAGSPFKCDGRIYCSQMSSCQEATYFLQHCPGTKMDGDHNGVPCEQQWCK